MVSGCIIPNIDAGSGRETTIVNHGDFVIRLTPVTKPLVESSVNKSAGRSRAFEFRVSRGVLISHSAFFQDMFRVQPTLTIVSIENNGISRGLEVWLRAIHNGAGNIPSSLSAHHSEGVWNAIAVGQQFGFAPQHATFLKPWFLAHYHKVLDNGPGLAPMVARSLSFPCFFFDHAEGFMKLTKYLAYNTNTSLFTESFQTPGVDVRLLDGPLTTARTYIQSTLQRELYIPLDKLHQVRCVCRKETAFDYEDALIALDCWPLDNAARKFTLSELFEKLAHFDFQPNTKNCKSGACSRDFNKSVEIAIQRAKQDFHGMNRSKPVIGQPHEEFIKKNSPHVGCWDMDCRFGHGRPSWFFSWMGPSSSRTLIVDRHRHEAREKRQREGKGTRNGKIKRGTGRPTTSGDGANTNVNRHGNGANSGRSQGTMRSPGGHGSKENRHDVLDNSGLGAEDDDEFFDAEEDTILDGLAANEELDA